MRRGVAARKWRFPTDTSVYDYPAGHLVVVVVGIMFCQCRLPLVLRPRAQAPASPMAPPGSTCTHQTGHQPAYGCSSGLGIAERDVGITFGGAGICPLLLARLAPSFDAYLDLSESAAHELDAHADASWGDRNIYPKWTHPHLRRCGCPTPSEENLTTSLVGRRLHHVHGV